MHRAAAAVFFTRSLPEVWRRRPAPATPTAAEQRKSRPAHLAKWADYDTFIINPNPLVDMKISEFLAASRSTPEFRDALARFLVSKGPSPRIDFNPHSPPVKIERVLTMLLASHPEWAIDAVEIDGVSGCEYFRGTLRVQSLESVHAIEFRWDCRWKAEQQGWTDAFGFPDQIRAARDFGYDCFREWSTKSIPTEASPVPA
jgi:hypothetical protein